MIWRGKKLETMGDTNIAIQSCKTKQEAKEFYDLYRSEVGDKIARHNIGYSFGYMNRDEGDRLMDLFGIPHPLFGRSHPTPIEAFNMGKRISQLADQHGMEAAIAILENEALKKANLEDLNPWYIGTFDN